MVEWKATVMGDSIRGIGFYYSDLVLLDLAKRLSAVAP